MTAVTTTRPQGPQSLTPAQIEAVSGGITTSRPDAMLYLAPRYTNRYVETTTSPVRIDMAAIAQAMRYFF